MRTFDVVVIGGGPAGEEIAGRLGGHGLEVAVVEDRLIGGECAYWACMPSKALLRPYEALAEARRVPGAAEAVNGGIDVPAVLRGRDDTINRFDDSTSLKFLQDRGVVLFRGRGRVAGERRVLVADEELAARRAVVLAGGSVPLMPPIEGLDRIEGAWTNREATTAQHVPERLLVVGGGQVGVELAQAFQTMGKYQARLAADHILGRDHATPHGADGALSPRLVFTDPQVAAVGHTAESAPRAGLAFDAYDTPTSGNLGGFVYDRAAPGTTRFLVDRERHVLIGCTITGSDVAEFLHAATIAVFGELPLERLRHAVPPFPTRSELWLGLL